ncbi:hypothetical protein M2650_03165 [Luteimonas sp. SX5]|uniref:Uncharacterized protein n=1 Tax=Luteimonas galliterrae TaxID=2940486 RepID=A0ABT0MFJ2_9GAMM|nr:hypothetical protein [Luteimonas galliterrae]
MTARGKRDYSGSRATVKKVADLKQYCDGFDMQNVAKPLFSQGFHG